MKFAHKSVSPSLGLERARIMSTRMSSKMIELTCIPIFLPFACSIVPLIREIKTMTCGTHIGASPTTDTFGRMFDPGLVIVIRRIRQPSQNFLNIAFFNQP